MTKRGLSVEDRFWAKVDRSGGPDACWPWTGCLSGDGYGHFCVDTQSKIPRTAQSVALELTTGEPAAGRYGLSQLCNPPCCNPAHLAWGTHEENQAQKKARGRAARLQGEDHPSVKLTDVKVLELRARYIPKHSKHGASALARELGMSQYAISQAVTGRSWRHI